MPGKNEKTWQTEGNILVNQTTAPLCAKEVLWNMVALLTGKISAAADGLGGQVVGANGKTGLWTVVGSSDGVVAALDGVDRWGATFDPAKLVPAANGAAHSWVCLRSPDALGPVWVTFDLVSPAAAANNMSMLVYNAAPSVASTTNSPAGQAYTMLGGTTANNAFVELVAAAFRCNLILSVDGEFWFTVAKGGAYQTIIGVQRTDRTLDPVPVVGCFAYNNTANLGPFGLSASAPLYTNSGNGRAFKGRGPTGTATEFTGLFASQSGNNLHAFSTTSASSYAGPNQLDGTYDEIPLFLFAGNATGGGVKGRIPDAYVVAANCPEGAVAVDENGKIYSSCVSDAWLPWTADYTPIV